MDPQTRVFQVAYGENLVFLACTVFDWSTRVMDGRTELRWLRCTIAVPPVARINYYRNHPNCHLESTFLVRISYISYFHFSMRCMAWELGLFTWYLIHCKFVYSLMNPTSPSDSLMMINYSDQQLIKINAENIQFSDHEYSLTLTVSENVGIIVCGLAAKPRPTCLWSQWFMTNLKYTATWLANNKYRSRNTSLTIL